MLDAFENGERQSLVKSWALEKIFGAGKVPTCDSTSAKRVEQALKEELKQTMAKAAETGAISSNETSWGPPTGSGH